MSVEPRQVKRGFQIHACIMTYGWLRVESSINISLPSDHCHIRSVMKEGMQKEALYLQCVSRLLSYVLVADSAPQVHHRFTALSKHIRVVMRLALLSAAFHSMCQGREGHGMSSHPICQHKDLTAHSHIPIWLHKVKRT